jgi:mono/diheme cytochrome c family protein
MTAPQPEAAGSGPPLLYVKFCEQCHGPHGEGGRQGRLSFPPLLGVAAKPRRTVDDIVGVLKDPPAYGLEPPMRSFSDKLTEPQMREIAEWIVKLQK